MSKCPNPNYVYPESYHRPETCPYCNGGTFEDNLKKAVRFCYITLGYYATAYNYDPKNIAYHPITGEADSGIMADHGRQAKEAMEVVKTVLPNDWEKIV